ncbi:MAG TPA: amidohydrolase [Saprospirales bacterium]|nr:amidohydrolase [Saprospirales bacterium]HAY71138.1 amidohydrolase [Saprospirales bacterium]
MKIAFIQSNLIWADPKANRNMFDRWFRSIHSDPDIIVLPETFNTGFPVDPKVFAESMEGESMAWLREKAIHSKAVVCASLLIGTDGKYYNSLIWMKPDGTFSRYDKRHVFRMGGEDESITPGQKLITENLKGWKIRPMICYDLRFPVWCRNQYVKGDHDYDLLMFLANWPKVRSYPWTQLLIARAIENQSYVLGVNRVGMDDTGNEYSGDSCLIDPKGDIIATATSGLEEIVEASLSFYVLHDFRSKFNVGLDWDDFDLK